MKSIDTGNVIIAAVRHHLRQNDVPMARLVAAHWKDTFQSADAWALWALVCLHPEVAELEEGIRSATKAVELSSTSALCCLALANAHLARGDVEAAKVAAARAVALDPDESEAAVVLSTLHLESEGHSQALHLLTPLADRPTANEVVLTAAAELVLNHEPQRAGQAMGWLRRAITLAPHKAESRALKAMCHLALDDISAGRSELQLALALHPDHPEILYQLARLGLMATGRREWDEAIISAQRAVALSPSHWRAKLLLSDLLSRIGLNADAFKVLTDALEAESQRPELWLSLARQAALQGESSIAEEALRNAANTQVEESMLATVARDVHLLLGNWQEASAAISRDAIPSALGVGNATHPDPSPVLVWAHSSRDLLMNARFLPFLRRRYSNLVLCLAPELHGMAPIVRDVAVQRSGARPSAPDSQVLDLATLPHVLKDELSELPAVAHIGPQAMSVASTAEVRRRHDGPCWFVGPSLGDLLAEVVKAARDRSALLIVLSDTADDIRRFQPPIAEDQIVETDDWDSVCSWMQVADAVVLADDTLAHIAGAQGVAAQVLIAPMFDPQWGWKLDRSLWFPSVELHRVEDGDPKNAWRSIALALGVAEVDLGTP